MKFLDQRRFRSEKGAAVVEFAIIVPLLLLIFFGIIEFSLIMYNKQIITNASREGARYGIVARNPNRTVSEIQDVVINWAKTKLITFGNDSLLKDANHIAVTACYAETSGLDCTVPSNWTGPISGADFGDKLKVEIAYEYDFLLVPNIPLFGVDNILPGKITLNAETVMNYE